MVLEDGAFGSAHIKWVGIREQNSYLVKTHETDLPALDSPHPALAHLWVQRLLGELQALGCVSCLSTRDLLQVHF